MAITRNPEERTEHDEPLRSIGFFGGTFDPVHTGHTALVRYAVESGVFDRVFVTPLGRAPHKSRRISMAGWRLRMTQLAFAGCERVTVSAAEMLSDEMSYTVTSLRRLNARYPEADLWVITGSDVLDSIETWYQFDTLLARCGLFVFFRGEADRAAARRRADELRRMYGAVIRLNDPMPPDISSTMIRRGLMAGEDMSDYLDPRVNTFIRDRRLYRFEEVYRALSDEEWTALREAEALLFHHLTAARHLHSLGTMEMAGKLALWHGLNPARAMTAGLLHDIGKSLDRETCRRYAEQYGICDVAEPNLWHGPAGAALLRERYGVTDDAVLEAVAYHSTGRPGMTDLTKIVYLADKIEYGRTFARLDVLRQAAFSGKTASEKQQALNHAARLCTEEIFKAMERDGVSPNRLSRQTYEALKQMDDKSVKMTERDEVHVVDDTSPTIT